MQLVVLQVQNQKLSAELSSLGLPRGFVTDQDT